MKKISILFLVFYFVGCAHNRVTSYDKDQVTVCGNRYNDADKAREKANTACNGKQAVLIGGFQNRELAGYEENPFSFNQATKAVYKTEDCFKFKCE